MNKAIYIVRHTQVAIDKGICYGQLDVDVSANFTCEAILIRDKMKRVSFDQILSSPLKRCTRLAYFLSEDVVLDNRLKELNFGLWEGTSWEHIFSTDEGKDWFADYMNRTCPGGESFRDLQHRVSLFIDGLTCDTGNILIVTHDGVIRCMLHHWGLINSSNIFDMKIPYGQIIKIEEH